MLITKNKADKDVLESYKKVLKDLDIPKCDCMCCSTTCTKSRIRNLFKELEWFYKIRK